MKQKRILSEFIKLPRIKRYMTHVVEAMGYNVTIMPTLAGKYYASLQAFELEVIDENTAFTTTQKLAMLTNGHIDKYTEIRLEQFLKKKGIYVPEELYDYGQLSADLVNIGRIQYNKLDNKRLSAGKSPLVTTFVKLKNTPEEIVNGVLNRRQYILDYEDDEQYFLGIGKKGAERRTSRRSERKEDKSIRKLTKKEQKITAKADKKAGKQAQKELRRGFKLDKLDTRSDKAIQKKAINAEARVALGGSRFGEAMDSEAMTKLAEGIPSIVQGMAGGKLGSLFGGGGARPDINDITSGVGVDLGKILAKENDGSGPGDIDWQDDALFQGQWGAPEFGVIAVTLVAVGLLARYLS